MLFTLILFVVVPLVLFSRFAEGGGDGGGGGGGGAIWGALANTALTGGLNLISANRADKKEDPDRPKRRRMTKNFERMMMAINAAWDRKQQAMIGLAQAHTAAADQLR